MRETKEWRSTSLRETRRTSRAERAWTRERKKSARLSDPIKRRRRRWLRALRFCATSPLGARTRSPAINRRTRRRAARLRRTWSVAPPSSEPSRRPSNSFGACLSCLVEERWEGSHMCSRRALLIWSSLARTHSERERERPLRRATRMVRCEQRSIHAEKLDDEFTRRSFDTKAEVKVLSLSLSLSLSLFAQRCDGTFVVVDGARASERGARASCHSLSAREHCHERERESERARRAQADEARVARLGLRLDALCFARRERERERSIL